MASVEQYDGCNRHCCDTAEAKWENAARDSRARFIALRRCNAGDKRSVASVASEDLERGPPLDDQC